MAETLEAYPGQAREKTRLVQVCSMCHRSSCWLNIFNCENSRCSSTEERTVGELDELKLENRDWYSEKTIFKHTGQHPRYQSEISTAEPLTFKEEGN